MFVHYSNPIEFVADAIQCGRSFGHIVPNCGMRVVLVHVQSGTSCALAVLAVRSCDASEKIVSYKWCVAFWILVKQYISILVYLPY